MKKLVVILLAAFALAAPRAQAQVFNHMSLGPTVGLDGVGIDIAMPIGPKFQVRAGYGIDPIPIDFTVNLGTFTSGGKTVDLNNLPVSVGNWTSGTGHLLFDFYPAKNRGFHLSAGVFMNNGKFLSGAANLTKVLDKADWGTLAIGPEGGPTVSTDTKGMLNVDVKHWNAMPYVGIGFGRAIDPERVFRFVFDMGLLVWGSPQIQSYNYVDNTLNSSKPVKTVVVTPGDVVKNSEQAAKLIELANSIPVCPYIRFSFYFRLF